MKWEMGYSPSFPLLARLGGREEGECCHKNLTPPLSLPLFFPPSLAEILHLVHLISLSQRAAAKKVAKRVENRDISERGASLSLREEEGEASLSASPQFARQCIKFE